MKLISLIVCLVASLMTSSAMAKEYMSKKEFLQLAFQTDEIPSAKTLWLNDDLQQKIKAILDHTYPKLRLRYWQKAEQSVWFLEEIGKEKPITFGVSIQGEQVSVIRVLAFRESRGYEIRYQAFTEQFDRIGLTPEGKLDQHIDGITGATMSVNAMKKITRMALMLAKIVNQ